jgi:hypothetical protein
MSAKICIALALVVLFLALAVGNPFLPVAAAATDAPPPAAIAPLPGATLPGAALPGAPRSSAPVSWAALRTTAPQAELPVCPDPALQPLVVAVRYDAAGALTWILRDGRELQFDAGDGGGASSLR